MTSRPVTAYLITAAVVSIVGASNAAAQSFTNRTDLLRPASNSSFVNPLGASSVDFDGDGRIDIYQKGRLYRNLGDDGFEDVFPSTDIDEGDIPFGAIFGDYDDDGLLDIFFMDLNPPSNLLRNDGDGTFTITDYRSVLDTSEILIQGSVWFDFDEDGDLDLFVGGDGVEDELFENHDGTGFSNAGQFNELVIERGVYGAAAADFDRDGDMDIYVTACRHSDVVGSTNMMWINDGGSFYSTEIGVEDNGLGWGTVWLDYDNDGWLDLFVANDYIGMSGRTDGNVLYRNNRDGTFDNVTESAGVGGGINQRGFGVSAADFDNDGWTDIYVLKYGNGTSNLYRNNGDGTFTDVLESSGITTTDNSAVTVADYDADGYVDVFLGTNAGGELYMNDGGSNHWLEIRLRGTQANRFGIGARIELYRDGEPWQVREITAGDGMTSQNHALMAHFGLGTATDVDSLQVLWPGGDGDRFANVPGDRIVTIDQGGGLVAIDAESPHLPSVTHLDAWPNPFDRRVNIAFQTDRSGRWDIRVYDVLGREVRALAGSGPAGAGGSVSWDGKDAAGVDVPVGIYLIRVNSDDHTTTRTVTRAR